MKKTSLLFLIYLVLTYLLRGAATEPASGWENWRSLLGTWAAEGKGTPGAGAGKFSFTADLQNRVIVRKSHTDYPATDGRPAFAHDDLMIIYHENQDKTRADYFDNEGHVIRYTAKLSADNRTITFLSDPQPAQPTFRLTYALSQEGQLSIKFEIAPPNAPNDFKVYVEGSARRQ